MPRPHLDLRDESPRCPLGACDGSGFVVDEHTNTASDCGCRAQRIARSRARRLRDRVPRRYMDLSWDRHPLTQLARDPNPTTADSVRKVKRYCADIRRNLAEGRGLWLMGHTGTGKTTLGYIVAATAAAEQHTVLSFNAVALLNRIRGTFDSDNRETTDAVIRTLGEVDLLHIEDLRVVRPTEWVLEQLYLIVNTRYEERRAIVFTSDIDSDADGPLQPPDPRAALEPHVGARTFSRLFEMCGDPAVIAGRDNRLDLDVPGVREHPLEDRWGLTAGARPADGHLTSARPADGHIAGADIADGHIAGARPAEGSAAGGRLTLP